MCRLFALWANEPTSVKESLLGSPHALIRQSCGDREGRCHGDGWGIGYYAEDQPWLTRAARPAHLDGRFAALAESLVTTRMVAHVRQASVGTVVEKNTHPFRYGPWLFAHNGTLHGFAADPERLLRLIPQKLRQYISGDTDSEHLFYFLLGCLSDTEGNADTAVVSKVMADAIRRLTKLYPDDTEERSRLNFVLTHRSFLVASRWGHTLYWRQCQGCTGVAGDRPERESSNYRAFTLASEPTTTEADWREVPDQSIVAIGPDRIPVITSI